MSLMETLGFVKREPKPQTPPVAPNPGERNPNPNNNANAAPQGNQQQAPQGPEQNANQNQENQNPPTPLDKWSDLWKTKDADPNKPKPYDPSKVYEVNDDELGKQLGAMDFTRNLNPQIMQQIAAGGEGAAKAFMEAMNAVSRNNFGLMTRMMARMVNDSSGRNAQHFNGVIDKSIKTNAVRNAVKTNNPALNHPAAAPLLEGLQSRLQDKFPQASPEEISNKAREYLSDFLSQNKPADEESPQGRNKGEADFSSFLDEGDL